MRLACENAWAVLQWRQVLHAVVVTVFDADAGVLATRTRAARDTLRDLVRREHCFRLIGARYPVGRAYQPS
jgi:hypothetical protein